MSEEVINKIVGFQLTGNIVIRDGREIALSPCHQTFEIEIIPGKIPSATITDTKRDIKKPIAVELPKELKDASYEKTYAHLFLGDLKLIVSNYGYEKMGNRKLLTELIKMPTQHATHVSLIIQGEDKDFSYKVIIDPHDINNIAGEIQDKSAKEVKKAAVELKEMKHLDEKMIKKILLKLKPNNFHVEVYSEMICISLNPSLKQYLSKPHLLTPAESRKNRSLQQISSEENFKEISRFVDQLNTSEDFRVCNTLFNALDEESFIDGKVLKVIDEILSVIFETSAKATACDRIFTTETTEITENE